MILDSSLKVCFVMLENFCRFVMSNIMQGWGNLPILTGIFYALLSPYGGFVPPFGVLMHPAHPCDVGQRERRNRLYFVFSC